MWTLLLGILTAANPAEARRAIEGVVVDARGEPIGGALITVLGGGDHPVEMVTSRQGWFSVTYLRNEAGERIPLRRRTVYRIEIAYPRTPGGPFGRLAFEVSYRRGQRWLGEIWVGEEVHRPPIEVPNPIGVPYGT